MEPPMRRTMIDSQNDITVSHQCELLSVARTSIYYQPKTSPMNIVLMHRIDELYTENPTRGTRRISNCLRKRFNLHAGRGKVRRLMERIGIGAIYPKKRISASNKQHKKYSYLLRDVPIPRVNQVWSTDINFIRLKGGFVYLVAVIDWYSRYVFSWRLSTTLDTGFCREALEEALEKYGNPEIFNTDQGCQFTSDEFTSVLQVRKIQISMDGKGRALDNVFVERLWRTVKYEDIYHKNYSTVLECKEGLKQFFYKYNTIREHQSLDYNYPEEVYFGRVKLLEAA